MNRTIHEGNAAGITIDMRNGVLHKVDVIAVRIIFTCVGTTGFFASLSTVHSLDSLVHEVLEFESFHEISIPDQRSVGGLQTREELPDFVHLLNAFVEGVASTEDSGVVLHGALHNIADFGSGHIAVSISSVV